MNHNILIVDDEIHIQKALTLLLSKYYNEVYCVSSGQEALEFIEQQTVDCILSDIDMNEMDGITLLKTIRQENNQVPFIFFTCYAKPDFIKQAIQYGAYDFIDKPDFDYLEQVIKHAIKHQYLHVEEDFKGELNNFKKILKEAQ